MQPSAMQQQTEALRWLHQLAAAPISWSAAHQVVYSNSPAAVTADNKHDQKLTKNLTQL
jgi:exoribonuclease II